MIASHRNSKTLIITQPGAKNCSLLFRLCDSDGGVENHLRAHREIVFGRPGFVESVARVPLCARSLFPGVSDRSEAVCLRHRVAIVYSSNDSVRTRTRHWVQSAGPGEAEICVPHHFCLWDRMSYNDFSKLGRLERWSKKRTHRCGRVSPIFCVHCI